MFDLDKNALESMRNVTFGFMPPRKEFIKNIAYLAGCTGSCKGACKLQCKGCKGTCRGKCSGTRKGK